MKKNIVSALILCCLLSTGFAGGCSSAASEKEDPESAAEAQSGENQSADELSHNNDNYAQIRPRASIRDELTVVFSKSEIELDFRKSYMANEAQIFTGLYEGLFSYNPLTMEPVLAAASRY